MKLKALLLACAVAGAGASFAFADDGGHGKHGKHGKNASTATTTTMATTTTTPSNCQRVNLRGTIATISATSLTLTVTRANDAGQAFVGKTATVGVDPNTRVQWSGTGTLTGPNVGDSAKVKASSCGTAGTLIAKSVRA